MKKLSLNLVKSRLKNLWINNEMDLETRTLFEEYIIRTSGFSEVEFFVLCTMPDEPHRLAL